MTRFTLVITALDWLSQQFGKLAAIFAPLMVLTTCYVVVTRYYFGMGSVAIQELIMYSNALIFMLGAAFTLKENAHVRVDVFYHRFSLRSKAIIDLLGSILLTIPVILYISISSWDYVTQSWSLLEGSADSGGLPYVYLLKSLIILMSALIFLQALSEALKSINTILLRDS
jgi:TRAP-type mannitol/chloroaromatic compound transport system permease small subunit